ncbi:MAG: tetratricopeptide repeat protein [Gallionella sp.]|nr:tetratricopeptide repeat protein [Gallionella sp.]
MSVINQVLNQLEQRGVTTSAEQTMVRTVPPRKRRGLLLPLLAVLALTLAAAFWQWRQAAVPVQSVPKQQPAAPVISALPESEEEVTDALSPVGRLSFELSSVPLPLPQREPKEGVVSSEPLSARPGTAKETAPAPAVVVPPSPAGNEGLPMKRISPQQLADAEFRKAAALMQQGRITDALTGYETALRHDAEHAAARQALVALLLEAKRGKDAERVLREGLANNPREISMAMLLARLQVERGELRLATETLEHSLAHAEASPDYHAFFAALLQRQGRHKEAISHYQVALQRMPDNSIWLMGIGISLQAVQRNEDARTAYRRALDTQTLKPELQQFVRQRLKGL